MNERHLNMSAAEFEQLWSETGVGQETSLLVTGYSMRPFLLHGRSFVYIEKRESYAPRRGDILLYVRKNGAVVLHRVVRTLPDGGLLMCGDAQTQLEVLRPEQIRAIVTRVCRRRRVLSADAPLYRLRARLWLLLRPVRPWLFRLRAILHKGKEVLCGKKSRNI